MATPILGIPELEAAQGQKYLTVNQALQRLDALVNLTVFNRTQTAPPGSPAEGHRYIVASGATGAFAGQVNNVAVYIGTNWVFFTPSEGWRAYDQGANQFLVYDGTAWVVNGLTSASLSNGSVNLLGVGATPTTTNRLSVTSPGVLFNRETNSFALTMNKQAAADTLQIVTQTNFSTRSIFGNLGNDDFTIRVSPNGSTFFDAVVFDRNNGSSKMIWLGLGGATPDTNNRLSINSPAALFNHAGGNIAVTLNKNAVGNDAGFIFQNNFSTRALFGLLADDNFTVKVSPNGSSFVTALTLNATTGAATMSEGYSTLATDAAFTINPFDPANLLHTGTLTAARACTLGTSGAITGQRKRLTRTGGGAFNITFAGKNVATGQWAEAVYNGTAWYLSAFGSL